jgi:arylesterase/paraoxonase
VYIIVVDDISIDKSQMRTLHMLFGVKSTSVGYCHVNTGCKIAADELYASNGIVRVGSWELHYASDSTRSGP